MPAPAASAAPMMLAKQEAFAETVRNGADMLAQTGQARADAHDAHRGADRLLGARRLRAEQEDGRARPLEVAVKLPDSVTRYRVMAIAAARENDFGAQESTITARLPLMVRPSGPRFLNFGDKFEFPVVLQNQTDKELTVAVERARQRAGRRRRPPSASSCRPTIASR